MVKLVLLLASLLVTGTAAIDIAKLLGLRSDDVPIVPEAPEQASTEQRQILQQIGSAVAPVIANIPSAFNQIKPTVTRTVFIQVTATHTKYPVCMTAYGVKPPCAALASHPEKPHEHHDYNYHENGHYAQPHEAYLVANNQAVLGHELHYKPELALAGYVPQAVGHVAHEDEYDNEHWEYKDAGIAPTASARALEATAMPELAREKRDVELDASVVTEPETESSTVKPHPRYLVGAPLPLFPDIGPRTITKTLYMTKVEKHTDYHVTATVVAENCIPDHIPFCASRPQPLVYASAVPVPIPVYVSHPEHKPEQVHHVENHPEHNPYTPAPHVPTHPQQHHLTHPNKPQTYPYPARPQHEYIKNNDAVKPVAETDSEAIVS